MSSSDLDNNWVKAKKAFAIPSPGSKRSHVTGSVAASKSAAGILTGSEKKLTVASEWYFIKPDGVNTIRRQFLAAVGELKATCYYDDTNYLWYIRCLPSDEDLVMTKFINVVKALAESEFPNAYDSDDGWSSDDSSLATKHKSQKLMPLSEWKRKSDINDDDGPATANGTSAAVDAVPENLLSYKFKKFWEWKDDERPLDAVLSDSILHELQNLTGCELALDLETEKVFVGAHSETECDIAIGRLEIISKYAKYADPRQRPIRHVFYSENLEKVKFQIKYYPDIKKEFFQTTLLDNWQLCPGNNYKNICEGSTIRLAPFVTRPVALYKLYKAPKPVPAVPLSEAASGSRLFGPDFTYLKKGDESQDPTRDVEIEEEKGLVTNQPQVSSTEATKIYQRRMPEAASQSEALEISSAHEAGIEWFTDTERSIGYADSYQVNANQADFLAGGKEVQAIRKSIRKAAWDSYEDYGPEIAENATRLAGYARAPGLFSNNIETSNQLAPVHSAISKNASSGEHLAKGIQQNQGQSTPSAEPSKHPGGERTIPADNQLHINNIIASSEPIGDTTFITSKACEIEVPKQQKKPSSAANLLDSDILIMTTEFAVLEPVRLHGSSASLIPSLHSGPDAAQDDQIEKDHRNEPIQETSEASAMQFYNTMNQKAPMLGHTSKAPSSEDIVNTRFDNALRAAAKLSSRSSVNSPSISTRRSDKSSPEAAAPPVDPLPEFVLQINGAFEEMMKGIRGFRGEVLVHAEFGRIILKNIHSQHIADDQKPDRLYEKHQLVNVLQPQRFPGALLPYPFFSKVLTTIPPDVSYLIDMKAATGQRLWGNELPWKIEYQFLGRNEGVIGANSFIIHTDGEKQNFKTMVKKQRPLGEIYVHGTKRNWDFRISAVGNEKYDDTYACTYDPLAAALRASLYIPEKMHKPCLLFELPNSITGEGKLVIDGIRVHRIAEFESVDGKSILKVSEVTELVLYSLLVPDKGTTVFKATTSLDFHPGCDGVNVWHEVSISSVEADSLYEQNKTLELGDETGWTLEDLSKIDAANALLLPGCEMLKQMDGIGYYNDNGVDPSIRPQQLFGEVEPEPPRFQWW